MKKYFDIKCKDPKAREYLAELQKQYEALEAVDESALTKEERLAYEDFWDKLGADRLLLIDSNRISHEEGRKEGIEEGRKEGQAQEKIESAKRYLAMGFSPEQVAQGNGMPLDEVLKLV